MPVHEGFMLIGIGRFGITRELALDRVEPLARPALEILEHRRLLFRVLAGVLANDEPSRVAQPEERRAVLMHQETLVVRHTQGAMAEVDGRPQP